MSNTVGELIARKSRNGRSVTDLDPQQVANGLGWFSIGLGLVELFGPRTLTWTFGAKYQEPLYQLAGVREVVSGVGVLLSQDKAPWLWARVMGDAMDVFLLGLGHSRHRKRTTLTALLTVLGVTALDVWSAQRLQSLSEQRSAAAVSTGGRRPTVW